MDGYIRNIVRDKRFGFIRVASFVLSQAVKGASPSPPWKFSGSGRVQNVQGNLNENFGITSFPEFKS